MILTAIVVCEVAFWLAVLGGLTMRYVLRRPRAGAILLVAAPVIDVALLALTTAGAFGAANLFARAREKRSLALIGGHLAFGVGGTAALFAALHGAVLASDDPARGLAELALGLLACAILSGGAMARLRNAAAATLALMFHISAAISGFVVALALIGRL